MSEWGGLDLGGLNLGGPDLGGYKAIFEPPSGLKKINKLGVREVCKTNGFLMILPLEACPNDDKKEDQPKEI